MNNDNNRDRDENQRENRRRQPFYQDNFPPPSQRPGMEEPPRTAPPGMQPEFPRMGDQPRTAPPNFIPEAPGMERRPMTEPGQSQFYYGQRFPDEVRPRELRRCLNRFTYIWLFNGNNFWFFPTFVGNQFVEGFRWRRNRWEYDRINLRRIFHFRCF